MKHTPGPWAFSNDKDYVVEAFKEGSPYSICKYDVNSDSEAEDLANANLIAAAPDLLAACKSAVGIILERLNFIEQTYGLEQDKEAYLRELESAIRKATGGAE